MDMRKLIRRIELCVTTTEHFRFDHVVRSGNKSCLLTINYIFAVITDISTREVAPAASDFHVLNFCIA
jgi:hypothetical protein